ncbi:acetamidase/formamidase family protein [Devosia rhodophyticola]|uniref:Acetamidase/formamidase family protein n=1 Tax=Devosia rhodophyticola TaxID=3026423 RepID=A0ABY7YZ49_9HYPH|nr:acetamidase/formamidase family protein [Devosia rhodophyticola]WDR06159.1 acetamidase/formamidase family protein [Devosia rhodophyticola]
MTTHRLVCNAWHNVLGTVPPALRIGDGDCVVTETLDAMGMDKDGVSRAGGGNPMNGPIYVEGAMPGDMLLVEILRMTPIRAMGWTRAALAANVVQPDRVRDLPQRKRTEWHIDIAAATVSLAEPVAGLEQLVLPLDPMIGCFGVAPALGQAFSTATSAENGGNMDYRGFGPSAKVWFPVFVPGALFFLGDCHAVQGDGEIVGTGVETAMEVEVRLSVVKGKSAVWPRGETEDAILTVGNARPLDQALQHATTEMFDWLTSEYGLSAVAASHLMGQVIRYDVGNVFDPAYTMVARIEKRWLPPKVPG